MSYNFKNKRENVSNLNNYMLTKTLSMFEYSNLPDSLPAVELEKLLQTSGYAFVFRHSDGEIYACKGGLGGLPDAYGNPTEIIISNPALKLSQSFNIKDDGVLILNDSMSMGLMPHFNKYTSMMVENDINLTLHGFNSRSQRLISASDSKTKESAEHYISKLIDGELTVIGENAMFEGVRVQVASTGSTDAIRGMLEYHQYLKSELYNEVGISQSHQLKRERLVSAEVEQERDSLYPLVYDMMRCRLEAVEKLNEKFGLEIEVSFGSVWAVMMKEFVDGVVDNLPEPVAVTEVKVETETPEDAVNEVLEVDSDVEVSEDVEVESTNSEEEEEQTDLQDGTDAENNEDVAVDRTEDTPTEEDGGEAETKEGLLKDTDDENDTK